MPSLPSFRSLALTPAHQQKCHTWMTRGKGEPRPGWTHVGDTAKQFSELGTLVTKKAPPGSQVQTGPWVDPTAQILCRLSAPLPRPPKSDRYRGQEPVFPRLRGAQLVSQARGGPGPATPPPVRVSYGPPTTAATQSSSTCLLLVSLPSVPQNTLPTFHLLLQPNVYQVPPKG